MSTVRVTSDGVVVDFSHDEVNTIEAADDTSAATIAFIGAAVAAVGGVVGAAAGIIAAGIALAIAVNKAQFALTDKGFGVEVTESWPAITFGFWNLVTMKPLGPGFGQFLLHTGTPIAQADAATNFVFAVGDYNRDSIPDVYGLKRTNTGTNSLEVHILNGADNYQSFLLHTGTSIAQADAAANFVFAVGDYNRDGIPDVYGLKHTNTGTNRLEVHILNGADNYQSFLLHTGTPIAQADAAANFVFAVGDYNRDGIPDLYCLKRNNTGTNRLEVHILNGADNYQSFLLQTGTPIAQDDAATNFVFAVGDYNNDGIPDVYCLKRTNAQTNRLEVHILNGADNYQSFLLQTGTVFDEADAAANFEFAVGDYNRDGIPDVYGLKRTNTGTNSLEVHILNVART